MAAAKKKLELKNGRKLKKVTAKKGKRDKSKTYYKAADKRPHAERFNVTAEKLAAIAERMKNG